MNMELARALNEAIDLYNEEVEPNEYIYWWDVINEIRDISDDEEVFDLIVAIERQADKLKAIRKAGY